MVSRHVPRLACGLLLAVVILLAQGPLLWGQESDARAPVPKDAAQEQALTLIREVYKQEYDAATTPAKKIDLAKKLLFDAAGAKDDPVSHFVMLRVARDLATGAGETKVALEAIDRLAESFKVDGLKVKTAAIAKLSKSARTITQKKALAVGAAEVLDEALSAEQYEIARKLSDVALAAARKARDRELAKALASRKREIEQAVKAHAEFQQILSTLKEKPTDPPANLSAGRYYCFTQGDWVKGIPYLALGNDPGLKSLAIKELKGVDSPAEQVKLGDGWWNLGQERKFPEKDSLLFRAGYWYEQAQPSVTSALLKRKLSQRLEEIAKLEGPATSVAGKRSRAGRRGLRGKSVKPFDAAGAELLGILDGHGGWVYGIAFSPDGATLVSGSGDRTVRFWHLATAQLRGRLPTLKHEVWGLALSQDGMSLAVADSNGTIGLWDIATAAPRGTLTAHTRHVRSVAFSPDGSMLASGGADHTVKLWNVATGKLQQTFKGHMGEVRSVAFSPDGSMLASASADRTVRLWDAGAGNVLQTLEGNSDRVPFAVFSPDGKTLVSNGQRNSLLVWDLAKGELRRTLSGHRNTPDCAAFHPDGSLLASGAEDKTIRLWDPAGGKLLRTIPYETSLRCIAFSPDGSLLATAGEKTVKLWGTDPNKKSPKARAPRATTAPDRGAKRGRVPVRRITFHKPKVLDDFVCARPQDAKWSVERGQMLIHSKGDTAYVTYRQYFSSISSVTIRGGIVPPSKRCFRACIGPIWMILNWEARDENHFRDAGIGVGTSRTVTRPGALVPGKIHEIRVSQEGEEVVVTIDGQQHYKTRATLEGTVTVYPALGSTIAVEEIVIEGRPASNIPVTGPAHSH